MSDYVSLIVKGPVKSAKRAAARHGINVLSCRRTPGGDAQCYAPCTPSSERRVMNWYHERARTKPGRGFPPGTLLYYAASCVRRDYRSDKKDLSGTRRRQRRSRRRRR